MNAKLVAQCGSISVLLVLVIAAAGCSSSSSSGAVGGGTGGTLLADAVALDLNTDGQLSRTEAMVGGQPLATADFDALDANSDGQLSLNELLDNAVAMILNGGQLYDNWPVVLDVPPPTTDHPLWATQTAIPPNARTGGDTWRCKECHGWDYKGVAGAYATGSHKTGFAGIFTTVKTSFEIFDLIKNDHQFGAAGVPDLHILDLTEFVMNGLLDTADILDAPGGQFTGSAVAGQPLFNSSCAGCHGADGLTPPPGAPPGFIDFPGFLSNDNPEEFQHKVSYGHPGSIMGGHSLILSVAEIGDLATYAQTLPQTPPPPGTPVLLRGGRLYDNWAAETGATAPTTDHPLWATQTAVPPNARTGADTWRCKECHGWDYKGVAGAYGTGSHKTGFIGIFNAPTTSTPNLVFDLIKNDHGYGALLTDQDILDLTEFVMNGQLDTADIIDGTGAFIVDPASTAGVTLYTSTCASCHGTDGLTPPPGAPLGFIDFPGFLSNDNPYEFQHKVSFGHPGSIMPGQVNNWTVPEIGNLGAHAQTLPPN